MSGPEPIGRILARIALNHPEMGDLSRAVRRGLAKEDRKYAEACRKADARHAELERRWRARKGAR